FVADFYGGLHAIDVSTPSSPIELAIYPAFGGTQAVAVAGNHVFLAGPGLGVYEGLTPVPPPFVARVATPRAAWAVAVSRGYAYAADDSSGLQVIDLSTPSSPMLVADFDTPGRVVDVTLSGNYAYVADGYEGLEVVDVSDPRSPALAARVPTITTGHVEIS